MTFGTRSDIWRVDCIGEGAFKYAVCQRRVQHVLGN